ncbi:SEC-C metal-binding domain-containing protein [Catenulispora rubra]|uniref:SEC-C metal-binding domain-containing protein n=1 Tax=Catenulispora rubra TaxID=280293 RepID=UPI00189237DD|nr:SEC-C domain-containing protein [Catenulispora rubra]
MTKRRSGGNEPTFADYAAEAMRSEADAEQYPESRADCLLEAAESWARAGEPERASALLRPLIAEGGENAEYARFAVADIAFGTGDTELGYAELAGLRAARPRHDGPCQLAAELLAERGDLAGALEWYNLAVARLSDADLEEVALSSAGYLTAGMVLAGRAAIRSHLGFTPDDLDRLAPEPGPRALRGQARTGAAPRGFTPIDKIGEAVEEHGQQTRVQVLVYRRADLAEAESRWPDLLIPEAHDVYYRRQEQQCRQMSENGTSSIILVAAEPQPMAEYAALHGGTVHDDDLRLAYLNAKVARGDSIAWPPPRNGPCWCGSGVKYKKCCGSPANR